MAIEWEELGKVLSRLEKERGRPFVHERLSILKAFVFGYAEGETSVLAVWKRCTSAWIWKVFDFSEKPSYDTFRRFMTSAAPLMNDLIQQLVNQCVRKGVIKGMSAAIDTSKLPTIFRKADHDAKWNYDDTEEEYYYGYALHAVVDVETELPLAFDLLKDKKIGFREASSLWRRVGWRPEILLADSEYDIVKFLNKVLGDGCLPIVEYNPRNAKERKFRKFRAEIYSGKSLLWLKKKFRERSSVERSFNVIKNDLRTKEFRVRGYERVKSHCGASLPPTTRQSSCHERRTGSKGCTDRIRSTSRKAAKVFAFP